MGRKLKYEDEHIKKKYCNRCWEYKAINEFLINKRNKDIATEFSWCEECRKDITERHRLWASNTLSSHKGRGFKVNIPLEELQHLAIETLYCPVCGDKIDWSLNKGKHTENSPTLDRKENENTINLENSWIICYRCNRAKGKNSLPEFVMYCETVYKRYNKIWE